MAAAIKINSKFITVNGKRAGIFVSKGPWNEFAKHPEQIKLRCRKGVFPAEIRNAIKITNNSDMMTDYFESDCIVLFPTDALYEMAKAA